MFKRIDQEVNLHDIQWFYPQDGKLEIKVHEEKDAYTKVEIFENDRPHCYTLSGTIYLDEAHHIKMADGIGLFTPANKDALIDLLNQIGKRVDLSKYTRSHL